MTKIMEEPCEIWTCNHISDLAKRALEEFNDPLVTRFRVGRYHVDDINDTYIEIQRENDGWILRTYPSDSKEILYSDAMEAAELFMRQVRALGLYAVTVYQRCAQTEAPAHEREAEGERHEKA